MRLLISFIIVCIGFASSAQKYEVTYLESTGNNGNTKVFAVTTPVENTKVVFGGDEAKLEPKELACREVLNAILFDGVENYNQGVPLVINTNDAFAKSLVNPKTKTFMSYFKNVQLENSPKNKEAYHYIVELNQFNLLRLLKTRGSIE